MSMIGFPLLLIPLAIYNIIVFLMPGTPLGASLFAVPLMSGVVWQVSLSDILVGLGILMLMFEVMKGARPAGKYLTDHLLSFLVLGGAAAEFVLLPQFATSTFATLTALAFVDFIGGLALRPRRVRAPKVVAEERTESRRDEPAVRTEPTIGSKPAARIDEPASPPAPAAPAHVPTAAPVAEAVLSDRPAAPATPPSSASTAPDETPTKPATTPQPPTAPVQGVPASLQPANDHVTPAHPPR